MSDQEKQNLITEGRQEGSKEGARQVGVYTIIGMLIGSLNRVLDYPNTWIVLGFFLLIALSLILAVYADLAKSGKSIFSIAFGRKKEDKIDI